MTSAQERSHAQLSPAPARLATPANALTALRLLLAPACAWAIWVDRPVVAASLFALAVASDFADGPLARRRGEASAFGGLFDHTVDAIFVTTLLLALAARDVVTAILPVLVVVAFVQYVLDSRALAGQRLRTSALGRMNGIAYFALAGTPPIRDALGLSFPDATVVATFGWLLVATTLASIADRAYALYATKRRG